MRAQLAPPKDYQWIVDRTGISLSSAFRAFEALDAEGNIQGMVGYDNWMGKSCLMHVAVGQKSMALRCLLRPVFESLFVHSGFHAALGFTRADNTQAIQLARRLGFREAYVVRDGFAKGSDLVFSEMRREWCPWIGRERQA